ncbi:TerC/Alx family metal homeostasis membrane protein [Flagellimonas sp.]|uniref:TerC/Alx family metal homeostasis membrane protein n=1 Tax=Flagellimonas sp. TaxID=2058762 RepID=UPI003B504677
MITWVAFVVFILSLLVIDLVILNRKAVSLTHRKTAIETLIWITVAGLFSLVVHWIYSESLVSNPNNLHPTEAVLKYITGYLIELSLSVDNLFVMAMIFASFNIPVKNQHKILFYGILGAIIFRGLMIWAGVLLIHKLSWITYLFGTLLLYTAFRMLVKNEESGEQPSKFKNYLYKKFRVSKNHDGQKFFTIENGIKMVTPLFIALIMIELTDLLFAVDSIPAILAITTDPFIVFSSNMFAVLGLRSMYFFLANMLEQFKYLKYSVFAILVFVSLKLLTIHFYKFPEWFSLSFIGLSLLLGILVSLLHKNPS